MIEFMEIKVEEIRKGDRFVSGGRHFWTATADAEVADGDVTVAVQHRDGGMDVRGWDPGTMIGIERGEQ